MKYSSINIKRYTILTLFLFAPILASADNNNIEELYIQTCSVCHGEQGDGNSHARRGLNPPPKNFTTTGLEKTLTREYMIHVTSQGKPNTAMVGFSTQLSNEKITALVDYIRESFMQVNDEHTLGKQIYDSSCSVCHGDNGTGALWGTTTLNPPPMNFTQLRRETDLSRDRMISSVTHGKQGTAMTAFKSQLSAKQIESVVDYIYHSFMRNNNDGHKADNTVTRAASTVGMAVIHGKEKESDSIQHATSVVNFYDPLPNKLQGNIDSGRAQYLQNCSTCHGIEGLGDGPRAYFIFPRPRNFNHPASQARLSRPVLFEGIKNGVIGREMPAWNNVLEDQQIADITEYIFQTFVDPE